MMHLLSILLLVAGLGVATPLRAAELLMFRQDGCPYCRAWDRDVGPVYDKTDLGKRVPVRMLDIDRDQARYPLDKRVIYTPTFVLIDGEREVGRIEGYPGEDFFWGLLARLVGQLPSPGASGLSGTPRSAITRNEPVL